MKLKQSELEALKCRYEEVISKIFIYKNGLLTLNADYYSYNYDTDTYRLNFKINEEFSRVELYELAFLHYIKGNLYSDRETFDSLYKSESIINRFNL